MSKIVILRNYQNMPLVRFKKPKSVITDLKVHIRPNFTEKDLVNTTIWPFYKKMRVFNWKPLEHILETFKENGKLRARLIYRFKHKHRADIFNMHISRHEVLFFTAVKGNKVYESNMCSNYTEFDEEFCRYFKRKRLVLVKTNPSNLE